MHQHKIGTRAVVAIQFLSFVSCNNFYNPLSWKKDRKNIQEEAKKEALVCQVA